MGKFGLQFDQVDAEKDFLQLEAFLHANAGTYDPAKHEAWLDGVCMPELRADRRRALAWWQHGAIVGDAVLKVAAIDTIELKNFRVAPIDQLQDKGLGAMMLKMALSEAPMLLEEQGMLSRNTESVQVILDTTAGMAAASFFARHGFEETGRAQLYQPGVDEILMSRVVPLD